MPVTLQKWGNSVGVRIPKPMLELADLLAQCKPENRPDPVDWAPPAGREII